MIVGSIIPKDIRDHIRKNFGKSNKFALGLQIDAQNSISRISIDFSVT